MRGEIDPPQDAPPNPRARGPRLARLLLGTLCASFFFVVCLETGLTVLGKASLVEDVAQGRFAEALIMAMYALFIPLLYAGLWRHGLPERGLDRIIDAGKPPRRVRSKTPYPEPGVCDRELDRRERTSRRSRS